MGMRRLFFRNISVIVPQFSPGRTDRGQDFLAGSHILTAEVEKFIFLCYPLGRIQESISEGRRIRVFTFETEYTAKSMAVMARVLRKTVRKKRSFRSHLFGWIVVGFGLLLLVGDFGPDVRTVVTLAAILLVLMALLFEDRLNGYVASKRLLPGTEKAVTVFNDDGFVSSTEVGRTEWKYDKITLVGETTDFFVFVFGASHAQLYDKRQLQGGTADAFRRFIRTATGKPVQPIR